MHCTRNKEQGEQLCCRSSSSQKPVLKLRCIYKAGSMRDTMRKHEDKKNTIRKEESMHVRCDSLHYKPSKIFTSTEMKALSI